MRRSVHGYVSQLSAALLLLPQLVREFQRKSPGAVDALLGWIDATEGKLSGFGDVASAELAGWKGRILAVAYADARTGLRKRRHAVALEALYAVQRAVQDALQPHAARLAQARDLARQLLQILASSGAIQYRPDEDFSAFIDALWALCQSHEQLKPFAVQLRSLLAQDDIRLLLADEIELGDFVAAAS